MEYFTCISQESLVREFPSSPVVKVWSFNEKCTGSIPGQRAWVWANSGREWRTGKPGVLQSMGWQRVGHDLGTEQQQHIFVVLPSIKHSMQVQARPMYMMGYHSHELLLISCLDWILREIMLGALGLIRWALEEGEVAAGISWITDNEEVNYSIIIILGGFPRCFIKSIVILYSIKSMMVLWIVLPDLPALVIVNIWKF